MLRSRRRRSASCAATRRRRDAQLLDQPDVAKHEAGLTREVLDQLLLGGDHRVVGVHRHGDGAQMLALMPNDEDVAGQVCERRCGSEIRVIAGGIALGAGGPGGGRPELVAHEQPDRHRLGAGSGSQDRRHPEKDVIGRVRLGHPVGELGEHLVRGRSLAVHDTVGDAAREAKQRPGERADADAGDQRRAGGLVQGPYDEPAEQQQRDARSRDEKEQEHCGDDRLLQHDVEVPKPVAEDRDGGGGRDTYPERDEEREEQRVVQGRRLVRRPPDRGHKGQEQEDDRDEPDVREQPDLLAFLVARPAVSHDQGHDREDRDDDPGDADHALDRPQDGVLDPERVRGGAVLPRQSRRRGRPGTSTTRSL
jgi:hypothetical protein